MSYLFLTLFGLILGSFLNVCIYRIPREESIAFPPSHCPKCGHDLQPKDLFPVLSWLALRGKCRYCSAPITPRYPAVELLNALLFIGAYHMSVLGHLPAVQTAAGIIMGSFLLTISFIDLDTKRIPNVLTYPALILGLAISVLPGGIGILHSALGVAAGGGILTLISVVSGGGMGMGDAKLMAVVGAFFGWRVALFSIFAGSAIGAVIGLALMALGKVKRKQPIPFGPFLALGTIIVWALFVSGSADLWLAF